eukprot:gene10154-13660_t
MSRKINSNNDLNKRNVSKHRSNNQSKISDGITFRPPLNKVGSNEITHYSIISMREEDEDRIISLLNIKVNDIAKSPPKSNLMKAIDATLNYNQDDLEMQNKKAMIKGLIRDNRNVANQVEALPPNPLNLYKPPSCEDNVSKVTTIKPTSTSLTSVRVSLFCEGSAYSNMKAKLMVIGRTTPLEEILTLSRQKYNVGKKYNYLSVLSNDNKLSYSFQLNEENLQTIPDGSNIRLCYEIRNNKPATKMMNNTNVVSPPIDQNKLNVVKIKLVESNEKANIVEIDDIVIDSMNKSCISNLNPEKNSSPQSVNNSKSYNVDTNRNIKLGSDVNLHCDNEEDDGEDENNEKEDDNPILSDQVFDDMTSPQQEERIEEVIWAPNSVSFALNSVEDGEILWEEEKITDMKTNNDNLLVDSIDHNHQSDTNSKTARIDDAYSKVHASIPIMRTDNDESIRLLEELQNIQASPLYNKTLEQRKQLPIYSLKDEMLHTIRMNQVSLVSGETGSGKTTQLPSFILDEMIEERRGSECLIICTQPRRIAAISVAERVSFERSSTERSNIGDMVGYQIRLENRSSNNTRLLFCTTGVLLRKLQNPDFLSSVSHIMVDEVHERQVETDFLLTILKSRLLHFPKLKLIMMSATLQENLFSEYFSNCPVLYVKGRTFPVSIRYLPEVNTLIAGGQAIIAVERGKIANNFSNRNMKDNNNKKTNNQNLLSSSAIPQFNADSVAELVVRIITTTIAKSNKSNKNEPIPTRGNAILVFLSGADTIDKVSRALRQRDIIQKMKVMVLPLNGMLPAEQQRKVFKSTKPGEWKVVLATNIAETSITVDDVTHVVDTGFVKEMIYDPIGNISSLQEVFISRASARQRAGRAGRVQAGVCWRMYTEDYFNSSVVQEYSIPEIQRIPLEDVILQVLLLKLGDPREFLSQCLQPPSIQQIVSSLTILFEIKAVLPVESLPLTALGYHLARIPVDVRLGKMLIYASLLQCMEPALTIVSYLASKSPFINPPNDLRNEANRLKSYYYNYGDVGSILSDHMAVVNAYNSWNKVMNCEGNSAAYQYCKDNFLSHVTLLDMKKLREHFKDHMKSAGFILSQFQNNNNNNNKDENYDFIDQHEMNLVRCVLCAGLYPQIVRLGKYSQKKTKISGKKSKKKIEITQQIKLVQSDKTQVFIHPSSLLNN